MLIVFVLMLFALWQCEAVELLDNPDFEDSSGFGKWLGSGCTLSLSQDSYRGANSARVTARRAKWAGIGQIVTVEPDTRYIFKAFIKLTNHRAGSNYHTVTVTVRSTVPGVGYKYESMAIQPWLQKQFGWTEVGADYRTKAGVTEVKIYIQIEEPEVNYLFDTASFTKLEDNQNWEQEANDYIENSRKSDLILRIPRISHFDTSGLTIKLEQLRSSFAFGTAVGAKLIVNDTLKNYQDFIFNNFEWATIGNALKWRHMEKSEGVIDYETEWKAIEVLRKNWMSIRGHNVFWAVDGKSPSWIDSKTNLRDLMKKRVKDVTRNTTGRLEHWDVDNEALHGDYFERKLNDANISLEMFDWVHAEEPDVKLFLNEYAIVSAPTYASAYKNQGKLFKKAGKPIYGMGIQSHFKSGNIDMTALKYRLDKVAETGLPIWITELAVDEPDVNLKAEALKNVLTMYFGHPSIEGVVLWGFWEKYIWEKDAYLATGDDVTPNTAGIQYQTLRGQTWRTNIDSMPVNSEEIVVRAFQGDYKLTILNNGIEMVSKNFTLGTTTKELTINLLQKITKTCPIVGVFLSKRRLIGYKWYDSLTTTNCNENSIHFWNTSICMWNMRKEEQAHFQLKNAGHW